MMLAAVLHAPLDLRIESRPEPGALPPGFVRIAMRSVGICGSDVHYYKHGRIGDFVLHSPMVIGHEAAGIVVESSDDHDPLLGQVVALEPGIPCGQCIFCHTGRYNLCPSVSFLATPPVDGAMQQVLMYPTSFVYAAGELTPDEATLAEPLSVGIYAVRRCAVQLGEKVAVIGAGPIGVFAALAAEGQGATVVITDIDEHRRQAAEQAGLEAVRPNALESEGYAAVLECTGSQSGIREALRVAERAARIALIGMGTPESMAVNGLDVNIRGLQIQGIFRYANTYPAALALLKRYRKRLRPFLTTPIPLADLPKILGDPSSRPSLKTIVQM